MWMNLPESRNHKECWANVGKESAWLKKGMRMNKNHFAKRVVVAAEFLFLCAALGLSREQNSTPGGGPLPQTASPATRPRKNTRPPDFLAGLTLTDDQKAKIDQIRQNAKSRLEAVAKDEKLSPEAKDAMLQGYRRIENGQIFDVLTPEQQQEVRKRMSAWRAAARQDQHQLQQQRQVPRRNPSRSK